MLRFYLEVARTAFRRQLIYRWANLAGILTNAFFGAIFSYVLIALFHARASTAGYNLLDSLRYTWLMQAMTMVTLTFGWYDLMLTIRTGEVISDLSKPCDFFWYWFSRELGRAGYYLLFRGLPTYALGMLLFGIGLPGNWQFWAVYAVSFLLGALLGITYRFAYNIAAFWIVEARAVGGMATVVALFFTGSYVPMAFFPAWARAILGWLPFGDIMNIPASILLGKLRADAFLPTLLHQGSWVLVFVLLARLLTVRATRRVVVQGG